MAFLVLTTVAVALGFAAWNALLNNFAIERANFTGVELIEYLAEHKGVEDDGKVMTSTISASEHDGSFLEQEDEQTKLIGGLDQDISPHWPVDEAGITLVGSSVEKLIRWWLRA